MAECGTSDRLLIGLWFLVLAGMVMLAAGGWWIVKLVHILYKEKLCQNQKTEKNRTASVSGAS